MKNFKENLIGWSLVSIVILAIVAVISFIGGGIMKLFGFEYDSAFALILFFIASMVFEFPLSLISEALPKVLYREFNKITRSQAIVLTIILDTAFGFITMYIADILIDTVSANTLSLLIVNFVFSLIGIDIDDKK